MNCEAPRYAVPFTLLFVPQHPVLIYPKVIFSLHVGEQRFIPIQGINYYYV